MDKINKIARATSEIFIAAACTSIFFTKTNDYKAYIVIVLVSLFVRRLTDKNQ